MSRRAWRGAGDAVVATAPHRRRDGRGSAAPLAVVVIGVLVCVALMVTALAAVVADERRVETGADLGALAGAGALQRGEPACPAAAEMVRRNGAVAVRCTVTGEVVQVEAMRRTHRMLGHTWKVRGTARAGPEGTLQ